MRISDWSSDVCSSDLLALRPEPAQAEKTLKSRRFPARRQACAGGHRFAPIAPHIISMATMVAKAMMHIRGMRLAGLILAGLLVAIRPAAAPQDPGLEIPPRAQRVFQRQKPQRDHDYHGFLPRQHSTSLPHEQNT